VKATDRGMWRLIARRDFWVRVRERSFVVSTLINVAVISVIIVLRAFGQGGTTPTFELGVVGDSDVADQVADDPQVPGIRVTLVQFENGDAAERALRAGDVDAVLVGERLIGFHAVAGSLNVAVQSAARTVRIEQRVTELGGDDEDAAFVADSSPVEVGVLEAGDPNRGENGGIAFLGVLLLYGQLFGYGVWVASGVIEEKASRVVEILLSTVRARQLMAGKIVGIGALGFVQLSFIAGFSILLAMAVGVLQLPETALGATLVVLAYFVFGFAFYASLFAVAGSLVTRMEELQNVLVPINLIIFISFFISIGALDDPEGDLATFASIIPFSSSLAMPVRIVLGAATPAQIASSILLSIGATLLLIPVSGRLYAGAVLRTGSRVKLREAWRASA
jgi:ABC-2 type transport system permease protein